MRLSQAEVDLLKATLAGLSAEAKLYLFGSRVDDSRKGGDIDLLVISSVLSKRDLRRLRVEFFNHFGEQKMDILLDDGKLSSPFVQKIMPNAVLL